VVFNILTFVLVLAIALFYGYREAMKLYWRRNKQRSVNGVFGKLPFGLDLEATDRGWIVSSIDNTIGEHERMLIMLEPIDTVYKRNHIPRLNPIFSRVNAKGRSHGHRDRIS